MQLRLFINLSILVSYAVLNTVQGQEVIEVSKNDFHEKYADNVDVSGSVLAASYVPGSLKYASPDQLYVYIPEYRPFLNIVLSSIDGKYSADASFALSESQTGWIQIKLPTEYQSEYKKYLPNRLVAFSFADNTDMFGNYIQEVFPTSWGTPASNRFKLLINSAGSNPNITFKDNKGNLVTKDCQSIREKFTRVFNYTCSLSDHAVDIATTFTFSPDYQSSGKDYIIWPIGE